MVGTTLLTIVISYAASLVEEADNPSVLLAVVMMTL
jgi:hypothetical protein